jgi:hypothetical protein
LYATNHPNVSIAQVLSIQQQSVVLSSTTKAPVDLVPVIMWIAARDEFIGTKPERGELCKKYQLFYGVKTRSASPRESSY